VATIYVDSAKSGPYQRHLLRENYRQDGKVRHRTIANLSSCSEQEIRAIKLALRHKDNLDALISASTDVKAQQGPSVGALWLVYDIARELGITSALGSSRQGKLAMWQVIARVLDQGSRLSAVRLAGSHAACDILHLDSFNEDDLYANLAWLTEHQQRIEDKLFASLKSKGAVESGFYLYDVTSSYLEGTDNQLAAFGYNRDGKRGKRQIVIGLLCNGTGRPVSIEVFRGNTQDPATVASQVKKVVQRLGGGPVTFVGDRGMIKSSQIESLVQQGMHDITAITKPQIEALLADGTLHMGLFDQELAEVSSNDGPRYILRRNPIRAADMAASRKAKLEKLRAEVDRLNIYLQEHAKANIEKAVARIKARCERLRISLWVGIKSQDRVISLAVHQEDQAEIQRLDGCYVLKTDLTAQEADAKAIDNRYKDLTLVEQAFRTSKTVELEMRPVHVRLEASTRGHALVVMLAYRIVQELALRWKAIDATVQEGIDELKMLCTMQIMIGGQPKSHGVPTPTAKAVRLLEAARVTMPRALPNRGVRVATRKKLPTRRTTR